MSLFADTRLLVYLFVGLRLTLLLVYPPEIIGETERGLTTLGDFREHHAFSQNISADNLPYRDYWVEFPPVWPALTTLAGALFEDFTAWAGFIYLLMTACDVGNLLLLKHLGTRLHGEDIGAGLAWIYALLATPLIMTAWNFESLVTLTILAGLWFTLTRQPRGAGCILALGILTKYIPLLALPTVWKYTERKTALLITALSLGIAGGVLGALMLWGGEMAVTSLTVQFEKPSYQTVWALLDGNYGTGSFPGGAARYDAEAAAVQQIGQAATIPGWVRLIPFAALGLWLYLRPTPQTDAAKVAFFTLTLTLFMLWAQGWSPQWAVTLLPLILLNFPQRAGVLLALTLSIGALMEYPLLFRYTADTGNQISGMYRNPFALLILMRTLILGGISVVLIRILLKGYNDR